MPLLPIKHIAVIVAHPDDETLWAGATILTHPEWNFFIISLCRSTDEDRAPKFYEALKQLKSTGTMGELDDGIEQTPLAEEVVESMILKLLPNQPFDLVITHNPSGEYTKHIRHNETSKAVITLWQAGKIKTNELWTFAYEDGDKAYFPKAISKASNYHLLDPHTWQKKYKIITETYGFDVNSWEAETTPKSEAFWEFSNSDQAVEWLNLKGIFK